MSSFIETRHLTLDYGGENGERPIRALSDVSLSINEGEDIAILGHNGSGKSTLAKLLDLILFPTSGEIEIDGKVITPEGLSDDEIFEIRRKIGMVLQPPSSRRTLPSDPRISDSRAKRSGQGSIGRSTPSG